MKTKKRIIQPYDFCVLLFCLWNLLLFFGRGLIDGEYDWTALTCLSVSVFYFALREMKRIGEKELIALLVICSVLCDLVLWHYMVNPALSFGVGFLIEDSRVLASFSLFVLCLASAGYCRRQKKGKQYLYMVMAVLGSLCLFVSGAVEAVYLGAVVFLLIPLLMKPSVGRIRRVLELICMYFGLLCFMPLADFWLNLFQVKLIFSLENSVYLYLVFSVTAVGFMNWWDNRRKEPKRLLREFQKICRYSIAGILIVLFFREGLRKGGTMVQCMQKYKAVGCVLLVVFLLVSGKRLYEKYLIKGSVRPVFGLVSMLYLIQSAFFPQQVVTSLGYITFLSTALQYKKREKRTEENGKKRTKISKMDRSDSDVVSVAATGDDIVCEGDRAG